MASEKKSPRKTGPNKSAFIRQHPELTPAQVVAKGAEGGLKFSPAFVSAIRSKDRAGKKAEPSGRGSNRGRKPKGGTSSASDFIRSMPTTMQAAALVDAGKAKGIRFSANLVYAVRARMAGKRSGRGGRPVSSDLSVFKRMAFDLGITRAREALDELERGLAALVR
jgi:hypothetical protein